MRRYNTNAHTEHIHFVRLPSDTACVCVSSPKHPSRLNASTLTNTRFISHHFYCFTFNAHQHTCRHSFGVRLHGSRFDSLFFFRLLLLLLLLSLFGVASENCYPFELPECQNEYMNTTWKLSKAIQHVCGCRDGQLHSYSSKFTMHTYSKSELLQKQVISRKAVGRIWNIWMEGSAYKHCNCSSHSKRHIKLFYRC